jgi:hypothetical protein
VPGTRSAERALGARSRRRRLILPDNILADRLHAKIDHDLRGYEMHEDKLDSGDHAVCSAYLERDVSGHQDHRVMCGLPVVFQNVSEVTRRDCFYAVMAEVQAFDTRIAEHIKDVACDMVNRSLPHPSTHAKRTPSSVQTEFMHHEARLLFGDKVLMLWRHQIPVRFASRGRSLPEKWYFSARSRCRAAGT